MNGVQTRLKCKPNVKQCKRLVFPARSVLFSHNILNAKAISHFQANHILIRFVFPPLDELFHLPLVLRERGSGTLDVFERALQQHNIKLSSLQVLMYLGSTESIKLFLEHTDCLGIVSVRSITRELYSGQLRVVEIKGMPMLRDFSFAQPQGQESGLAQVFMQFAMHNNHKL